MRHMLTSGQIRQKFVDYYKSLGHKEIENVSLVPKNDPTTLFTGSGMQALIPYLMGQEHPLGRRLVNVQRCFRAEDLDEIGNGRHHSFFEMLGCWSLSDYFKAEQIPWTFSFFVDELGIDPNKLYVTVFSGDAKLPRDTEAAEIWKKEFAKRGMTVSDTDVISKVGEGDFRIFYNPGKKNWWERAQAPVGDPAGPDTEVFYFTSNEHTGKYGATCQINCDCGRYIEIGNDVFMQYKKSSQTEYEPLQQKNVDCGWGFERLVRVVQGKESNFETDLFYPAIQKIESLSRVKYKTSPELDWVYKICADHLRAAVFLIADGVTPSNKMQGYVLRRLLRRVIFQSRKLEISQNLLASVAEVFINEYSDYYKHLVVKKKVIVDEIMAEEERFTNTLSKGLKELEKMYEKTNNTLDTGQLEILYQTYGVPKELTQEICRERGWTLV